MLGGVPTAVETLRRGLERLGHEVVVVAPRMAGAADSAAPVIRVPAIPAPTYPDFALPLPLGRSLTRRLLALDLDVFHAHHPFLLGVSARRLARAAGRPLVFTYHTRYDKYAHYVPLPRGMVARPGHPVERRLRRHARTSSWRPPTSSRDDSGRRACGAPSRCCRPASTWSGSGRVTGRPPAATLGLPAADRLLLYVGRLDREKNLGFLLDAIARVDVPRDPAAPRRARHPGRRPCGARPTDLGLGSRVDFRGGVTPDRLARYYQAADLFVFASTTETQGLAVLEAMACGLPVVAVRASGIEEVVVEGVSGLLVPEDPGAFAGAVEPGPRRRRPRGEARGRSAGKRRRPSGSTALVDRLVAAYRRARGGRAWT